MLFMRDISKQMCVNAFIHKHTRMLNVHCMLVFRHALTAGDIIEKIN